MSSPFYGLELDLTETLMTCSRSHVQSVEQQTGTRTFSYCRSTHSKCSVSTDEINKMPVLTEEIIGRKFLPHFASLKGHPK